MIAWEVKNITRTRHNVTLYVHYIPYICSYVTELLNVRFRSNVTTTKKKKKENQSGYVDNIEESNLSVILHLLPLKLTSIIL
jgi:hypothetical protein